MSDRPPEGPVRLWYAAAEPRHTLLQIEDTNHPHVFKAMMARGISGKQKSWAPVFLLWKGDYGLLVGGISNTAPNQWWLNHVEGLDVQGWVGAPAAAGRSRNRPQAYADFIHMSQRMFTP